MEQIKVLLADDHAIVRAGIHKMIEEIPGLIVVAEVGDGTQVLSILANQQIDCLIIDVNMPEFEPFSVIRKIRNDYPQLKILVVSAYDDDIYVQGLLSAGVNGYHLKDQPLNDLKLAVRRILEGERWISSPLIGKLLGMDTQKQVVPNLTNRQRELLRLLQQGFDNQTIAQEMSLSIKTIENHLTRLYRQLDVQSRLEAVHFITRCPQILGTPGQDAVNDEKPYPQLPAAKSNTILIVDDNARYRMQLKRMIGKLYPRVIIHEAESIHEATTTAKNIEIKLALIDVVLMDEDGITCARRIKAIQPQTRVVLISAYPDREFHRQGIQSGAIAFLDKKDLDLSSLRQVLDDIIS